MVEKTTIRGYTVAYDEKSKPGIEYLGGDLSYEEMRVFFDQARMRGSASFEDDSDRDYTLFYQNGAYVLTRRS